MLQSGENGSGRPALTMGMDFKGKTSSAAAKPPISGSVVVGFLEHQTVSLLLLLPFWIFE